MSGFRLPGPLCRTLGALEIDEGTLCLRASSTPRPVCVTKIKRPPEFLAKPAENNHILQNPETYIGSTAYANNKGNHECVAFAQMAGNAPLTSQWKPGAHIEPGMRIARGTWVATFVDGKFHGHVGAFDSMDKDGNLTLIDQFNSRGSVDRTTYHVKKQPYTGNISNDPSKYFIVIW